MRYANVVSDTQTACVHRLDSRRRHISAVGPPCWNPRVVVPEEHAAWVLVSTGSPRPKSGVTSWSRSVPPWMSELPGNLHLGKSASFKEDRMPSAALANWTSSCLPRLDELEQVHLDATGRSPGRRWGTTQFNRNLFVALVAQFQT